MSYADSVPPSISLNRFVGWSVTVHVLIVLVFTVKTFFFDSPIEYKSAVRVDLIGLPDKAPEITAAPPAPSAAAPAPLEEKKPAEPETKPILPKKSKVDPDAVKLDKTKSKEKAAMAKLKQMDAFEKIKKDLENERSKKAAESRKLIRGNQVSSGSELTGLAKIEAESYIADVERQVHQNWALPEWLSRKSLNAQVRARFDEKGALISVQVVKSSGNPSFDEIALDTVQKSSPVPPPPEKFVRLLRLEGILFGFPE